MMIFSVVANQFHSTTCAPTDAAQAAQKRPGAGGIEAVRLAHRQELAVAQAHGTKITHFLAGGVVQHHRVFDFGCNPHPATRTMLLKMHLVHSPDVNVRINSQRPQFFYMRPVSQGPHGLFEGVACVSENPSDGTDVDIDGSPTSPQTDEPDTRTMSFRPTGRCPPIPPRQENSGGPFPTQRVAPQTTVWDARIALLRPNQQSRVSRNPAPNTQPCAVRLRVRMPLEEPSCPALPTAHHAIDDRTALLRYDEFHPAMPEPWNLDQI